MIGRKESRAKTKKCNFSIILFMDRPIKNTHTKITLFKKFDYLDLFPYSIAVMMLGACVYILNAFIVLAGNMKW